MLDVWYGLARVNTMSAVNLYREKAEYFTELARSEPRHGYRDQFQKLAVANLHLAELAEHNRQTDVVYETSPLTVSGPH